MAKASRTKKIYVGREDSVADVIDKAARSDESSVVLNFPRFTNFKTLTDFELLKRGAAEAGKDILIESVDDEILNLASLGGLTAINPLFQRNRRPVSDIVVPDQPVFRDKPLKIKKRDPFMKIPKAEPEESVLKMTIERRPEPKADPMPPAAVHRGGTKDGEESEPRRRKISARRLIYLAALFLFLGLSVYAAIFILPRVEIEIVMRQSTVEFDGVAGIDKDAAQASVESLTLPGELFVEKGNLQLTFPASGVKQVEDKAKGKIIIYNAFDSAPQTLVATTRFLTPDNKLYRLDKTVTVPGAKVVEGKIVPSSVTASVTADKPGEEFNIGPVARFAIPGFKGSPKYEGFYGESKEPMTGGFIGQAAVPTEKDLENGRGQLAQALSDSLRQRIFSQWPEGFKVIEGAQEFVILEEGVNERVPEAGKFGIFAEAELKVLAFKERDFEEFFVARAMSEFDGEYEVLSKNFDYGPPRADFQKGRMLFPIKGSVIARRALDLDVFRRQAVNKEEAELKALIFAIPGLENAKISFWPFWVNSSPDNPDRIGINVK